MFFIDDNAGCGINAAKEGDGCIGIEKLAGSRTFGNAAAFQNHTSIYVPLRH